MVHSAAIGTALNNYRTRIGIGCLVFRKRVHTNIKSSQPFNAFLSGFSATVGQFVLTASLRIQTNPENKAEFESTSNERYDTPFSITINPLCFFLGKFSLFINIPRIAESSSENIANWINQGIRRLHLWQPAPPLLLRQLHQLVFLPFFHSSISEFWSDSKKATIRV